MAEPIQGEVTPTIETPVVENNEATPAPASVEAAEEVVADPTATKEEKKEAQKLLKKFKLKVDGVEEDFELDLNNEEELKKHLQLSKASQKRMAETAQMRKAAEQLIELLRTDPKRVLSDKNIGIDVKEFAKKILEEEAAEDAKTPEQKEIERLRKELEEATKTKEDEAKKREADELAKLQKDAETQVESDIQSALEASNLPKTPYTVKKLAELMYLAYENDIAITAKDAIPLLRDQMQKDIKQMFEASSDDVLEEMLGAEIPARLQKRRVAKSKKAVETAAEIKPTGNETEEKAKKEPEKKLTVRDFFGI